MAELAQHLDVAVVAVDREVWAGEATMVIATTTEGDLGVLPGHAPLLGELIDDSLVRIFTDQEERSYRVEGGHLSVTDDGISVLAEQVTPL